MHLAGHKAVYHIIMKKNTQVISFIIVFISFCITDYAQTKKSITVWQTDPLNSVFFKQQSPLFFSDKRTNSNDTIAIDETQTYQSIDGFGFSLTGGSAMHLMKMSASARLALLKELFGTDHSNIGTSYLRISIGASDLDEKVFSYDDLPDGQTDTLLKHFNLGYDKQYLIPVLKEILTINHTIKILGSPWSPPVWMKNNHDTRGGNLLKECYPVYAKYFAKYIQSMRKEGIVIDAITVQNEPLHPGNNPSLQMFAADQAEFIKNHLGPAFTKANIKTKIIIYDHNADKPEYPISVLDDPEAKKYIDGSAFHLYGGKIEALSKVHEAHPDKNIYFTEQWIGAPGNFVTDIKWSTQQLIIGATRNWAKTVLEWNLSSNPELKPYTDRGGCNRCLGAITINQDTVTRNPAYYIIAQAAKFVRPGSVRIASNLIDGIPNVAFKTPAGKIVLITLNSSKTAKDVTVNWKNRTFQFTISSGGVNTFQW